jgi:low molecular weight protein-tyrosine phosphatase
LSSDIFRIAVICTGNRFRSPLAEHVLRRETAGLPVEVESFGLLDNDSAPVLPELEEHAAAAGLDVAEHRSRQLARASLADADLVIGFERRHIARAVVHGSAPLERTFTLPELVELLEQAPAPATRHGLVAEATAAIAAAAASRPSDPRRSTVPEIADPLGRPPQVVADIACAVRSLSVRLATTLFGQ